MLEAGISLIAACLPTLSYLITHFSMQSALKSARSMLSLPLLRSSSRSTPQIHNFSKTKESYTEIGANSATGSTAEIFPREYHAMADLSPSTKGIHVKHEVSLTDNMV